MKLQLKIIDYKKIHSTLFFFYIYKNGHKVNIQKC